MKPSTIAMKDEQLKESKMIKAQAAEVTLMRAQAFHTATRQSYKRKLDQIESDDNSDKENIVLSPTRSAPAVKRIRREKTGTEWQTVLDVVKFGEEQRRKQKEIKACAAVFETCSECYLQVTHISKQ
ncbi:uncharacterized protein F5891DRAFT_981433 [Suillus fuscotomentosus]|uniref:Uncharacterized protein n=1 Tax=Suillus fuscotomentosus TaxID=1912939 RepID=A0AAD4HJQ2_9AGAM|nr:uncharacterized protein F5891DRAFT_981433 [Suillus fuscotomentosus]KAG1899037.1 hypothetical protein F5891DRAFT_981433 [Suillus fuscotomentosus]